MRAARTIRLQLVLRAEWRNARGVAKVRGLLRSLGFEPVGAGRATVSARSDPDAFAEAFGAAPVEAADLARDAGAGLSVPDALRPFVESITVAPAHQYFGRGGASGQGGTR